MKPFERVNVPFNRELATSEFCRGDSASTSTGTVFPFKMKKGYMIFKPRVFSILKPDTLDWCEVYDGIAPHIDVVATVRLNMYCVTNGATTTFYTTKPNPTPYMALYKQAQDRGVPSIYRREDLEFHSSFVAQKFDSYVLDTKVVHDVTLGDGHRAYIQFSWKTTPYAEVLDRLRELQDEVL
jgi:hypothetical protein